MGQAWLERCSTILTQIEPGANKTPLAGARRRAETGQGGRLCRPPCPVSAVMMFPVDWLYHDASQSMAPVLAGQALRSVVNSPAIGRNHVRIQRRSDPRARRAG